MRRITAVCTLILLCAGVVRAQMVRHAPSSGRATSLSLRQLFDHLSPSVVTLEGREEKGGAVTVLGTAVAVAPGELVTNRHVINSVGFWDAKEGNSTWPVQVIWVDPDHDLSLLRTDGLELPAVVLGPSRVPAVGNEVFTIGSPEGLEQTLSEGIISGLRGYEDGYAIQTSAPISPGSSGGGLFDEEGRLIGITTFGLVEGQNLNFALPVKWVKALLAVPAARHPGASSRQLESKAKYRQVSGQAEIVLMNVATFAGMGWVPSPKLDGASRLYTSALVGCTLDKTSPECIDNWPIWQQASLLMYKLRTAYETLGSSDSNTARSIMNSVSSVWSDVSDVYCQVRPGGIYTNLEGKIRACP